MIHKKRTAITTVVLASSLALTGLLAPSQEVNAEESASVQRLNGETRFQTAALTSRETFNSSDTVIIANYNQFADALAGVPLAHQLDAPILLVRENELHPSTAYEIGRLNATEAVILGGENAVGSSVENALNAAGLTTRRLGGATRYETAEIIAEEVIASSESNQAVVVDGSEFADALSIAAFAAQEGSPIFLSETDSLRNAEALSEYEETLIIGGENAISLNVESELNNPTRLAGATRFETNVEVLEYFGIDSSELFVATGMEFADALTGGVLAASNASGVALTREYVPEALENYLADDPFPYFTILGGENAVPTEVETALQGLAGDRHRRATIVHTNDIHGRMIPGDGGNEDVQGLAFVHGVFDHYSEISDETILVDSGDTFHGTNNVHLSEGQTMVDVMNNMGYYAMAAGNHEFNYGWERLIELAEAAEFPVLAGNVVNDTTGESILPSHTEWEVFGNSFAIAGLVTQDTPIRTHPGNVEGITFRNDIEVAQEQVDALSEEFDHIMFLTHSGYAVEQAIAENVDGIDLIIGGHSHTRIDEPTFHNGTFIAQAWEHSKAVGVVHLDFVNGELVEIDGYLHDDREEFEANASTYELTNSIVAEVEEQLQEVIGQIDVDLDGSRETVRQRESNLGNLIADSLQARTGADFAIMNGGGIRESISAGDVTLGDVMTVLPFINLVESIEATGQDILDAFENSVAGFENGSNSAGQFLHVSSEVEVVYDVSQPVGSRVESIHINGELIDPEATYTVGMNDFMAAGGDGFTSFEGNEVVLSTGELMSELLADWIEVGNPIPEVEGRINFVD
jgi:2',3'-cyclic-nucleotide 2'-phosphodiesterase (5'-nucleotidase family)